MKKSKFLGFFSKLPKESPSKKVSIIITFTTHYIIMVKDTYM